MGVDIVAVGLRHKVRVDKPLHLIDDISRIYNAKIKVVYYNSDRKDDDWMVTLLNIERNNAIESLTIELPECQYLQQKTNPFAKSIEIDWESENLIKQLWDTLCNHDGHYSVQCFKDEDIYEITIYKENAEIFISSPFIWFSLTHFFNQEEKYQYPESSYDLQDYRGKIYRQAQLLGCNEVIYFPDKYEGEFIYDKIYKPVNELLHYIKNRDFHREINHLPIITTEDENIQIIHFDKTWAFDMEFDSIFIDVPDFIMNHRKPVSSELSIDVLFDDFRDLNSI